MCVKVGWGIVVGVTVSGSGLGSLGVSCCIYVSLLGSNSCISCCGCLSGIGCVFCVSGNFGCMFGVSGCCGIGVSWIVVVGTGVVSAFGSFSFG